MYRKSEIRVAPLLSLNKTGLRAHKSLTLGNHANHVMRFTLLLTSIVAIAFAQPPGGGAQQGDGIWLRNAYFGELVTFDPCLAHQPGNGQYHNHINPICLRYQLGDNVQVQRQTREGTIYGEKAAPWTHSPILGWAFDGYPIYGPYGYSDAANAKSEVRRIKSGFRLRNITARTSLPDWAMALHPGVSQTLTAAQYGPAIGTEFPLGRYNEDYEHVPSIGDLDIYNGRFAVTPDFPSGTYAYYVTIEADGAPAFPYVFSGQYYGTASGGNAQNISAAATEYFRNGALVSSASTSPQLSVWQTKNSSQNATAITGYDPSNGPQTTWPLGVPSGARISGGVTVPTLADVQRIRYTDTMVIVNANNLASYTMGPWFDPQFTGGVFGNFASSQNNQFQVPRTPSVAATKSNTSMGAVGVMVNGVAVFNSLDGASYRNASGADAGGGMVTQIASNASTASGERGPMAPGSLVSAYSLFGASLATSTVAASSAAWPLTLGGATVTVKDSTGTERKAEINYASANQVNYRVPPESAAGVATAVFAANGKTYTSNINIAAVYPSLFIADATAQAAATILRVRGPVQTPENINGPIDLGPSTDAVYLIAYGTGRGTGANLTTTATIGGMAVDVLYSGPQGVYPGLDQFNLSIPRSLAGRSKVDVIVTVAGKVSNPVNITIK